MEAEQTSPDFDEVRTFVALATTRSFTAAATVLGRDPTVLSRRLRSLEGRLGIRLADRNTRSFALTEAGQAYLARVRPLLEELDAAGREAGAFATGEPRGRLRVSLPGSFARLWLEPVIVAFMQAHPDVTLDARYSNTFVDLIGDGFDLAVRLGAMSDSRLIARKVGVRRRLVCAAPGYLARRGRPTDPKHVERHACLCFTGRVEPRRWEFRVDGDGSVSVIANCVMSSDDGDLLVAAARAGLGLFYTTDWHVGPYLANGELVEVLADYPVIDDGAIYVLTAATAGMSNKVRAFSDWIANSLVTPPWSTGLDDRATR